MLNDRPVPVKWRIALDLGPTIAATLHLLVFELLRCIGFFADLPGTNDCSQGYRTDAQILTALVLMNVAGLDRVPDIARLEEDKALRVVAEQF